MNDDWIVAIATVVAAVAAAIASIFAWRSARHTEQAASADLLLRLDERLRTFDDIHALLRPGGEWQIGSVAPKPSDWPTIDAYLGVFERIDMMVDEELLDVAYVEQFYGYRIDNILANAPIVEAKLNGERASWTRFLALVDKLGRSLPPTELAGDEP